jgi:predicted transcriptional regulator
MAITLDSATEQRLLQEMAAGHFAQPSELIAHALDLVEAERQDLNARRAQIIARLKESCEQAERGEGYTEEELRERMAKLRQRHALAKTA